MKKNLNKNALICLIALLMLFSATFFVFPVNAFKQPKPSQTIALTIHVTDQQIPGVENVTADFLASPLGSEVSSVTIKSTGGNAEAQLTYLQTLMQGGTATADVIGLDVIWTAQFAENGWIIELDDYLTANELDDYASGMVSACQYKGITYAYPYFMNLGILFYRNDLLSAEGFDETDFDTWEELNATANYILNNVSGSLTNPDLVGYVGQLDAYEGGVVNFFEWCGSNGALDLVTSTGEVNIDTDDVNDAMVFIKGLIPPQYTGVQGTPYIIPRSGLVHDEGSSVGVWLANNSIFMRQWTFAYGSSVDNNMDFGVAPLPHFQGASGYKTSAVGGAILAVPSATTGDARDAAVNFIKFLGDPLAQERELTADIDETTPGVQALSNFPALKSIYDNPPAGFEWIQDWTDQLDLTLSRPVHPSYPQVSSVISDYFSDLLSCQKSVDTALEEMQRDVSEIVAGGPTEEPIPGYSIAILLISIACAIGIIIFVRKRNH